MCWLRAKLKNANDHAKICAEHINADNGVVKIWIKIEEVFRTKNLWDTFLNLRDTTLTKLLQITKVGENKKSTFFKDFGSFSDVLSDLSRSLPANLVLEFFGGPIFVLIRMLYDYPILKEYNSILQKEQERTQKDQERTIEIFELPTIENMPYYSDFSQIKYDLACKE